MRSRVGLADVEETKDNLIGFDTFANHRGTGLNQNPHPHQSDGFRCDIHIGNPAIRGFEILRIGRDVLQYRLQSRLRRAVGCSAGCDELQGVLDGGE